MKSILLAIFLVFVFSACSSPPSQQTDTDDSPVLKGPYFGQKPPGLKAEKFNDGVLVGDKRSFNVSFSPDGKELFFSYYKATQERPHPEYEIKFFKQVDNIWYGPETAFFSGEYSDVDITFSPDGKYLFFKRRQGKDRGIHWISTEIIENLKKKVLK